MTFTSNSMSLKKFTPTSIFIVYSTDIYYKQFHVLFESNKIDLMPEWP